MLKFTTETGSQYEVDEERSRIRRTSGSNSPTVHMGKDGKWKKYQSISSIQTKKSSSIVKGHPVMILWGVTGDGVVQTTITSVVKGVCYD